MTIIGVALVVACSNESSAVEHQSSLSSHAPDSGDMLKGITNDSAEYIQSQIRESLDYRGKGHVQSLGEFTGRSSSVTQVATISYPKPPARQQSSIFDFELRKQSGSWQICSYSPHVIGEIG